MKDLYQILGLAPNASGPDIKKAFRHLALANHPDHGGSDETMKLLNDAYETLYDNDKRTDYDASWHAYQSTAVDEDCPINVNDYIASGSTVAYSQAFKFFHQDFVKQYQKTPLNKNSLPKSFGIFKSNCYDEEQNSQQYSAIFAIINAKNQQKIVCSQSVPTKPLSINLATTLFIDFLKGQYFGKQLTALNNYLTTHIDRLQKKKSDAQALVYFTSIQSIILMADKVPTDRTLLLLTLQKITDFAKNAPKSILSDLIPLFYNKFFRNLYGYAQHLYWQSSVSCFTRDKLSLFDGFQQTKALLNQLRAQLADNKDKKSLIALIKYIKLLCSLEKDLTNSTTTVQTADKRRQAAFELLNWIPAIIQTSSKSILTNLFLQLGSIFQDCS